MRLGIAASAFNGVSLPPPASNPGNVLSAGVAGKVRSTGATTLTTASATTVNGSTIFLLVAFENAVFTSITDNKGNTYTQVGTEQAQPTYLTGYSRLYVCYNAIGGAGHTFTVTTSSSVAITLMYQEIRASATMLQDVSGQGTDSNNSHDITALGTTALANEIVVAFMFSGTSANPATHTSTGFTVNVEETDGSLYWTGAIATQVVSSPGVYTPSWTISDGTASSCMWAVAVKAP